MTFFRQKNRIEAMKNLNPWIHVADALDDHAAALSVARSTSDVAAPMSMPRNASACATSRNIILAFGMPVFFQSLTLGMERLKMRDTSAVPPNASIISVAWWFMRPMLAQANINCKPKLIIYLIG